MTTQPWPVQRRTSWLVTAVLLGSAGAGGLVLGVAAVSTDGVGILLVGSPLLIVAGALVYLSRARRQGTGGLAVREVAELAERGVVLPYSAALGWGYVVAGVYCLLFFGLIAVGGLAAGGGGGVALLVAALLVCGYLLWCVIDLARGRLQTGLVALTPSGIYHRSWAMRSYLPWNDVVEVVPADVRGPLVQVIAAANTTGWVRRTSSAWRQGELAFAPHLAVQGRFLAADPALLYRAVRFYLENPAARAELGNDAALTRFAGL
ncbi:hypothetical protein [Actinophytocola xanthii]|uniref:PH domain-containing protein n=1 Tax=Actinophytocola xanthii TaxID=1912961 RepID=A0A1Q8CV38_9PSEU|nr:hypothetical protein [Actinophytocola xanthii]OLF18217.1 hypothetical protein BU204_06500 [Actinophytocola xanthii]